MTTRSAGERTRELPGERGSEEPGWRVSPTLARGGAAGEVEVAVSGQRGLVPVGLILTAAAAALVVRLPASPPIWWDEGWTLAVARTWVQTGHYGRLLEGLPASPGLAASFAVVAPVAASLRLFGAGVWSARLVGALFMLGALALLYLLAHRLYGRAVATGALAVVLLTSFDPETNPLLMGRQVLGEPPMLLYLLAGYACLLGAWRRPLWLLPAVMLWAVALAAKAQVLPFWALSLLVPLLVLLARRRWRPAGLLAAAFVGSLGLYRLALWAVSLLLRGHTIPDPPLSGLYGVTALVPVLSVRLGALLLAALLGLPTVLGLLHGARRVLRERAEPAAASPEGVVRLALLTLSGSWLAWYVLLSVGWPRYLFPATFVGSLFAAAWLHEVTGGYRFGAALGWAGAAVRTLRFDRQSAGALLAIAALALAVPLTIRVLAWSYLQSADTSVQQVAADLNALPGDARVETYESELFFFLDRPYHFPPDRLQVDLSRRSFLHQDVPIDYDPLAADPDYLVTGPSQRLWHLYDPVLETGTFRPLRDYGRYTLYQRVR